MSFTTTAAANNGLFKAYNYPPSVAMTLESFDFEAHSRRVPTHILGFSSNFCRMQKRLQEFHRAMDPNPDACQQQEREKWNAMSALEQEECEANLQDLKHQKSTLLALQPASVAASSPCPAREVSPVSSPEPTQASSTTSRKRKATEDMEEDVDDDEDEDSTTEVAFRTRSALARKAPDGSFSDKAKKQKTIAIEGVAKRKSSPEWTHEEDQLLRKAVEEEGLSPNDAAVKYFSGKRTDNACRKRWNSKLKHQKPKAKTAARAAEEECQVSDKDNTSPCVKNSSVKPHWSPNEDAILKKALVDERLSYAEAARTYFPGGIRTEKACENRWHNKLKHSVDEEASPEEVCEKSAPRPWTKQEDDILRKAMEEERMSLKMAAKTYFTGSRSRSACDNRWYGQLKHAKATTSQATKKQKVPPPSQAIQPVLPVAEDNNNSCCQVCHNGGDLVCCDGCPQVYHSCCVVAGKSKEALLADVEPWYCPDCFLQQDCQPNAKETVATSKISESSAAKNAASEKPRAWETEEDDLILKRLGQGLLDKDIAEELSGRTALEIRERCDAVLDPCFDVRQKARKAMQSHRRAPAQQQEHAVSNKASNNTADKDTNSAAKYSTNSTNSLAAWFSAPMVQRSNLYDNEGYDI